MIGVLLLAAMMQDTARPIVIASKPFAESYLLAEMFAQTLEANGLRVERRMGLGATEIAFRALRTGAIGVAFQPKVDSGTCAPTGVEALARWTHPALGAIGPDEFVPLAEASGLMGLLTSSVLRQALTACRGWQRRSPGIGVAVNVSADTLLDGAFVTEVAAILTSVGVAPSLLTLELTEGVVMADPALAAERMGELRAIGVNGPLSPSATFTATLRMTAAIWRSRLRTPASRV
jgi:EAL domain-containing protein (putative c-di-GMP-specific phosphodiesterase class I)